MSKIGNRTFKLSDFKGILAKAPEWRSRRRKTPDYYNTDLNIAIMPKLLRRSRKRNSII